MKKSIIQMSLWVRLILMGPVVHCYNQTSYSGANYPPEGAWWPKQLGTNLDYLFFAGPPHGGMYNRDLKLLWESGYKGVYANDDSLQTLMDEIGFTFNYTPSSITTYSSDHMTDMETFYSTTMASQTPVLLWNSDSWDTAAKTLQLYRLKKGSVVKYSWETEQHATIRELCSLGYVLDTSSTSDTYWVERVASEASDSDTDTSITAANTTCKNYTDINTGAVTAMYNAPFMKYIGLLNTSTAVFAGGQTGKVQEEYLLKAGVRVILNLQGAEPIPLLNKAIYAPRDIIDSSRFVNWTSCSSGGVDDSCPDLDPTTNYEGNNADKYGDDGIFNITKQNLEKDANMHLYAYACCSDWNLDETYSTTIAAFRKANELGAHLYSNCAVGYRGVSVPLAFWGLVNDKTSDELMTKYEEAGYHEFPGTVSKLLDEAESDSWCGSLETGDVCTDAAIYAKLSISLTLLVTLFIQAI